ncbi:hypothetical protein MJG53_009195 [Ovis ammon polii x Ovis aries]|uniref:Uncharacterized protein n=1 Tax=Ovis ammon polii x Ovis aries TaxID=2918886 RepID=A0ACB9UYP2_9CETA|nr:hypothetical protein MJG53_009195 [Ovis ammon polii x Ovis aries]
MRNRVSLLEGRSKGQRSTEPARGGGITSPAPSHLELVSSALFRDRFLQGVVGHQGKHSVVAAQHIQDKQGSCPSARRLGPECEPHPGTTAEALAVRPQGFISEFSKDNQDRQ